MLLASVLPVLGPKYIAIRKSLNQDKAQEYCSEKYKNGALCSFQNDADFQILTELIGAEPDGHSYWTGLKKKNGNYKFSDGTSPAYAQTKTSQLCEAGCDNENGSCFIEETKQPPYFKLGTLQDTQTMRFICQVNKGNIIIFTV